MKVPERVDLRADPDADLSRALSHLDADLPLAYPTETVYGLGGAVTPAAVRLVQRLKGRDDARPLLILVEQPDDVASLRWTGEARALAEAFWPGALTLVLEDTDRIFPAGVRSEHTGGVGVRVSPHPLVGRLLGAYGRPLTSTSLNARGERPARSGTEAVEAAERLDGGRILVLDAGTLPPSEASTVVDCTHSIPLVLRAGSVPVGRLRCVIPEIHERSEA
ncbi:MAG: L-threonylcarbamoyladenylate synthase [Gemmatimonadota bacterium]